MLFLILLQRKTVRNEDFNTLIGDNTLTLCAFKQERYVSQILKLSVNNMTAYFEIAFKQNKFCFWYLPILLIWFCVTAAYNPVGETIPEIINIGIGSSANITCHMNIGSYNKNNSTCLYFREESSHTLLPKENIHILNENTIIYMIKNATEQLNRYVCYCNEKGVGVTQVAVGTLPITVTDLDCSGYDFVYFQCKFTVPKNSILTTYKVNYSTNSPDYTYECTLVPAPQTDQQICNITQDTRGYRILQEYYNFTFTATNSLGNISFSILKNQYRYIVPAKPEVEIQNITADSVVLFWKVVKNPHYTTRTKGLIYEIQICPENFNCTYINESLILNQTNSNVYSIQIPKLQYAFHHYEVKVRVKTGMNKNDDTKWSEECIKPFRTKSRLPDYPPIMDIGSFYIDPNESKLRLYWQQLPKYRENGLDFGYIITVRRNGNILNILPDQNDTTSATYQWDSRSLYEFEVRSKNREGESVNASTLRVHSSSERSKQLAGMQMINKVYHHNKNLYTVSWGRPIDTDNLVDFTVFWCTSRIESPSQCQSTIYFKHLDKYVHNYTSEPNNQTLNFAVSVNYRTYSTGMIWAMCTADETADLPKLYPEVTSTSASSIKLQWSTECLFKAILVGYNLQYCKVKSGNETKKECIVSAMSIPIVAPTKEWNLTGLEPYTNYKILIGMYSKIKVGPMSTPIYTKTSEDAPSAPEALVLSSVSNSSAVISWSPPAKSNGIIRSYNIWCNGNVHVLNNTGTSQMPKYVLRDLKSFTNYTVYVEAVTVKQSPPSEPIHFMTLVGRPSKPRSPKLRTGNSFEFYWTKPEEPAGHLEFYEVRVTVQKGTETNKISRVVKNSCMMERPSCNDRNYTYYFSVRAVNIANKNIEVGNSYYSKMHQGASKKRRHSNAEINPSKGPIFHIQEKQDHELRHRYERENFKSIFTTASAQSTTLDNVYESLNEELRCSDISNIDSQTLGERYNETDKYILLKSDWADGAIYECIQSQTSKVPFIVIFIIALLTGTIIAMCYLRKKYYKMSDIGLVIPEGLDDNIHPPKGVDNEIERDEISRTEEMFDKENHHLLSKKNSNDSGFLAIIQCLDKSGYECSDNHDNEKSSESTDSVELNDITSCSYTSSPTHSPNTNTRGTVISENNISPGIPQIVNQIRPSENGYIKPMMLNSGYVPPQIFQNLQNKDPLTFNGYTTLDAMMKPQIPDMTATSNLGSHFGPRSKEITTQSTNGNICGYVTHKQLSDFGQRLQ